MVVVVVLVVIGKGERERSRQKEGKQVVVVVEKWTISITTEKETKVKRGIDGRRLPKV